MALLLSRILLPELANKIYSIALQEYVNEIVEYKCFTLPLIFMKHKRELNENSILCGILNDVIIIKNSIEKFNLTYIEKYKNFNIIFPVEFKNVILFWINFIKDLNNLHLNENYYNTIESPINANSVNNTIKKILISIEIMIN